jgi:hypothetical protein
MKNKSLSLNIIFTLLFLILSALFLIYIFRNIQNRECFEGPPYSWKYGEGHTCGGFLNTATELRTKLSDYNTRGFNRFHDNTLYRKNNLRNASHPYRNYCDVMNFNDLLAYKCLKKSPIEMEAIFVRANVASTIDYIYVYDEKSLYSYILAKITSQKDTFLSDKIVGPVYVCISQSPYLRYKSDYTKHIAFDKTLDARIDILNNRNPYYFEHIDSNGVQRFKTTTVDNRNSDANSISSLYCHILIVYPLYDKNMKLKESTKAKQKIITNQFLDITMKPHYTDNELCFIKCNKANTLTCGCLSRSMPNSINPSAKSPAATSTTANSETENNERDMPAYSSKCIDHTNNNAEGNFTMMYFVNPYSDSYGDGNIIEDPEPIDPLPGVSQQVSEDLHRAANTCSLSASIPPPTSTGK